MIAEMNADTLQRNSLVLPVVERDNEARDYSSQKKESHYKKRHDTGVRRIHNARHSRDISNGRQEKNAVDL